MKFSLTLQNENLQSFMRRAGYKPIGHSEKGELNCIRPLSGPFPRFHAYIKEERGAYIVSLHLDQKRPSYAGAKAHSGDYNSSLIQEEAAHLRRLSLTSGE